MAMEGFFNLQTPEHLLHKLEWEYTQWRDDPMNTYRAWNFFVTAEHLPAGLAQAGPASRAPAAHGSTGGASVGRCSNRATRRGRAQS
jgi:hypothetical protein